jgi:hypothetical protein
MCDRKGEPAPPRTGEGYASEQLSEVANRREAQFLRDYGRDYEVDCHEAKEKTVSRIHG